MRDEPSDIVLEWLGVTVEGGRVTRLSWIDQGLTGIIPSDIGALSALRLLKISYNELSGSIPPTVAAVTSLDTCVYLHDNSLSGLVPSTLSNLEFLWLNRTAPTNSPGPIYLHTKSEVQDYLLSLWRHSVLRLLKYSIVITKKRQDILSTPPSTPILPSLSSPTTRTASPTISSPTSTRCTVATKIVLLS